MTDDLAESPIAGGVRGCLTDFGYQFAALGDGRFRFESATEDGRRWRSELVVHETERLLLHYVLADVGVPPAKRLWVAEAVARLNEGLVAGSFDIHWGSGDVRFRNHADLRLCGSPREAVENLLCLSAYPLKVWSRTAKHLMSRKTSPEAAVEAARLHAQTGDPDKVTKGVRRAALELV